MTIASPTRYCRRRDSRFEAEPKSPRRFRKNVSAAPVAGIPFGITSTPAQFFMPRGNEGMSEGRYQVPQICRTPVLLNYQSVVLTVVAGRPFEDDEQRNHDQRRDHQ